MIPRRCRSRPFKAGLAVLMIAALALSLAPAVLAQETGVGPLAPDIDLAVKPDVGVLNDGTQEIGIYWRISGFTGPPDYYTLKLYPPGEWPAGTPMLSETSQGGADFPDIDGELAAGLLVFNEENTQPTGDPYEWPDPSEPYWHYWLVPENAPVGIWTAEIEVFTDDNIQMDFAVTLFSVEQATGDLQICKYNDENGNGVNDGEPLLTGWSFVVTGPAGDPVVINVTDGGLNDDDGFADGCALLQDLPIGDYTVTEVLPASGWRCTDPPSGLTKNAVITSDVLTEVQFGNTGVGDLLICKYNDENGNTVRDGGEPLLPGWTFEVSGPEYEGMLTLIVTDGDGNDDDGFVNGCILLSEIACGDYTVVEQLPASGWLCTDPGAGLTKIANVECDTTTEVEFGNMEQLCELWIFKYEEMYDDAAGSPGNPGTYDAGIDQPLNNWRFRVDGPEGVVPGPGGEPYHYTGVDGYIRLVGIQCGEYTVTETLKSGWRNTEPGGDPPYQRTVMTEMGGAVPQLDFGNKPIEFVPSVTQWGIIAMVLAFGAGLVWVSRRRLAGRTS